MSRSLCNVTFAPVPPVKLANPTNYWGLFQRDAVVRRTDLTRIRGRISGMYP